MFEQSEAEYTNGENDFFPQPAARTNLIMSVGSEAVAVATLDKFGDGSAAVRGVAVGNEFQRRGHGRQLIDLLVDFAKAEGVTKLCVNANPDKVGFYAEAGFAMDVWSETELASCKEGRAWPMPVQMAKPI